METAGGLGYGGAAGLVDFFAKGVLVEPAVEGALADLSGSGRRCNGSGIEQGRDGLLLLQAELFGHFFVNLSG